MNKIVKILKSSIIVVFNLGLFLTGLILGLITLLPDNASKTCYLGYFAHCSFAPISTIILLSLGLIGLFGLISLIKNTKKK